MSTGFESLIQATRDAITGVIEFTFDACLIDTESRVHEFFAAFKNKLAKFPEPRDVVICLDNLTVAADVRPVYAKERAAVAGAFYRYSARYAGTPVIRIAMLTSGIRYQADATLYETREEAFAAVLMRRAPGET